jgi:hypothetical protein
VSDEVKRVVMDADHQTLIRRHGLRDWVEKGDAWPAGHWNGVIDRVRDLFVQADLATYADDAGSVIAAVASLVVKRQTFIDHFLERGKGQLNYKPADGDEWRSIAEVVARILVQRYYRETKTT